MTEPGVPQVQSMQHQLHEIQAGIGELRSELASVQTQINSLPGSAAMANDIAAIKAQAAANGVTLSGVQMQIAQLAASVGNVAGEVGESEAPASLEPHD